MRNQRINQSPNTWKKDYLDLKNEINSSVRSKNGTTESADDGPPGLPVEGHVAEPGGGLHVGHAGATTAPRARSRRRLAPPHLPRLIH